MKVYLILVVLLTSCWGQKLYLSDCELIWCNPYQKGDTLIFTSSEGNIDTSIITDYKKYFSDYKPNGFPTKYKAEVAEISYKNSLFAGVFIEVKKRYDSKEGIDLRIDYLKTPFSFSEYHSDRFDFLETPISINSKEYSDIILITHFDSTMAYFKENPNLLKCLYWSKEYGLVKYITYSNEVWVLSNL